MKPASKQLLWQRRKRALGLCTSCGKVAGGMHKCRECRVRESELYRAKAGRTFKLEAWKGRHFVQDAPGRAADSQSTIMRS